MKKMNINKKFISASFSSLIIFGVAGGVGSSLSIDVRDDSTTPEEPPIDGDEETIHKAEALNIENQFYLSSIETIFEHHAHTNGDWDQPYYDGYKDSIIEWDKDNNERFLDTNFYKSYGYVDTYNKTSLADKDFNSYIIEISESNNNPKIINGFIQDLIDHAGSGIKLTYEQATIEFLKIKTIGDFTDAIKNNDSIEWTESEGFKELFDSPQIKNDILSKIYGYSWMWQKDIYSGIKYDYNITRLLANSPMALSWSIKEKPNGAGDVADLNAKEAEITSGDYNGTKWDTKLTQAENTVSEKHKNIDFWNDKSNGFDGVKFGTTGIDPDNVMDVENTWALDAPTDKPAYTKLGNYNYRTDNDLDINNRVDLSTESDNNIKGDTTWILDEPSLGAERVGVVSSPENNQFIISKVQTIMPVRVGIESSWNSRGNYYTSFKHMFNFNVYEDNNKIKYISDKPYKGDSSTPINSYDLWEWLNLDVSDARSELFIIDQLIGQTSSITSNSKEYWFNKGFYIELFGEDLENYGSLIDSALLK